MSYSAIQKRTWEILNGGRTDQPDKPDQAGYRFEVFILSLIAMNIVVLVLDTVAVIHKHWGPFFEIFDIVSICIFTIEYSLRVWSSAASEQYSNSGFFGRIKFMFTPLAILDLLAILPFYLPIKLDLRFLRALRLFRVFRLLKFGRYNASLKLIRYVFTDKREEIVLSLIMMAVLLLFSACLLYFIENAAQPEAFSSIPASMWWAVTALTTVGYGDIYPITPLGKVVASIIAISGIGMFALPAGIISSGFIESIQRRKQEQIKSSGEINCPHCGGRFHHNDKHRN